MVYHISVYPQFLLTHGFFWVVFLKQTHYGSENGDLAIVVAVLWPFESEDMIVSIIKDVFLNIGKPKSWSTATFVAFHKGGHSKLEKTSSVAMGPNCGTVLCTAGKLMFIILGINMSPCIEFMLLEDSSQNKRLQHGNTNAI